MCVTVKIDNHEEEMIEILFGSEALQVLYGHANMMHYDFYNNVIFGINHVLVPRDDFDDFARQCVKLDVYPRTKWDMFKKAIQAEPSEEDFDAERYNAYCELLEDIDQQEVEEWAKEHLHPDMFDNE